MPPRKQQPAPPRPSCPPASPPPPPPTSSLSSLPPPTQQPLESLSPAPPPHPSSTKHCPVCHKVVTSFSGHVNNKSCGPYLTDQAAAAIHYVRCRLAHCNKWVHTSRTESHWTSHSSESQSQPPPTSPAPSSPLSPSPTNSPAGHIELDEKIECPSWPVATSESLLPDGYQVWPHMFTYIPRVAQELWVALCTSTLTDLFSAYRSTDTDTCDRLILDFLMLPRTVLRRTANEGHANKKLARRLFQYQRQQSPPEEQPTADWSTDSRDEQTRRVSAATSKVQQGHVRKAVDALMQPGMLEITVETLEQLQVLHPDASAPLSAGDVEHAATHAKSWLTSNDISKRPDRFYDNGSAPGPSGWTGSMLRPLLESQPCRQGHTFINPNSKNSTFHNSPLIHPIHSPVHSHPIPLSPITQLPKLIEIHHPQFFHKHKQFVHIDCNHFLSSPPVYLVPLYPTVKLRSSNSSDCES